MKKNLFATASLVAASAMVSVATAEKVFQHVGTFDVMAGNGSGVAEIVDASVNGKQLAYTDSENEAIGFVDIKNPASPMGEGTVAVGGEPTSLAYFDPYVLVAVNTSSSYTDPSGKLVVVHSKTRQIVAEYELGGQPDSIALAPDHERAAIVIENERDEDLNDGLIPQNKTGALLIVDLHDDPTAYSIAAADLSPVAAAAYAGSDLEPEFVDINAENEAVVTFQENNHLAVIDLTTGLVISQFPAGSVELNNVDTKEEDLISLDSTIVKRREPDAVAWIDNDSFAIANEGDYEDEFGEEGGSRGFTIFNQDGMVEYESFESFEHWVVSVGQYNEDRSKNKGCEPESVEFGTFGKGPAARKLLFVGSERSDVVGIYDVTSGTPEPVQILPTGIGPEGLKVVEKRDLFVASTEKEVADAGIPTMITIYGLADGPALYPMIQSGPDSNGLPIPWVALSGLVADPVDENTLYAVSDSFLSEGFIYTIDVSSHPAIITERLQVSGASQDLDIEGIAVGPDGNFWLGSEGNATVAKPNLVLKVDSSTGAVLAEIKLPEGLEATARKNGIEGIAVTGTAGAEQVFVAIQRAWPASGDTDKAGTKIGRYDVATGEWGFVFYPFEAEGNGDWIGLSEITSLGNGEFAVIERDKGWGPTTAPNAELKSIYGIDLDGAEFRTYDDPSGLVTVGKTLLFDAQPLIDATSIWTAEKLEGFAVTPEGKAFIVTDNDGLDDAPGETVFLRID